MLSSLSDRAAASIYIALVLGLALATANVAEGLLLAVSPLLAVLILMLVVTRDGYRRSGWARLGMGRLGLRWWPVAIASTLGVSVAALLATVAVGAAGLAVPTGDWLSALISLCVTGPVLAFAEEIGWRGYLQPRLGGSLGAMLGVGIVWILWHLPYILFTPYYHSDGDRLLVLALFSAGVLAFSVLFGLLRQRSRSLWPAVLAHFVHNAGFAMLTTYLTTTDQPVVVGEYLAGDTGVFVLIGTVICVIALLLVRRSGPRPARPA